MKIALIHIGFWFDCEDCGEENFCRGVVTESHDTPKDKGLIVPEQVECWHCGAVFLADFDQDHLLGG